MLPLRKNRTRGFSVVELLIILVIIGILGLLVLTFYSGIQEKNRDNVRKTDIEKIQGAIESYNAQYGNFPTLAQLNSAAFRAANLKNLSSSELQDPKASSGNLVSSPASDVYSYAATPFGCDDKTTDCTGYTLTATLEAGGTFSKQNIN
jgi:general secretion pathway protein G